MTAVQGDLLEQPVEAIVNPWNRNLLPHWLLFPVGVSGAIRRRAGAEPFRELGRLGPLAPGAAVDSSAGRLPFRRIIHVVAIGARGSARAEMVKESVIAAVSLAERLGLHSLAFPILGAGVGGLKIESAEQAMLEALSALDSTVEVRIVRYKPQGDFLRGFARLERPWRGQGAAGGGPLNW